MGSAFVNVSGAELANVSIGYLNKLMNKALKQTTKHMDVDGQAWQSSQQNMPALMQIKENLQQQLGLDYAAHRQAHIPTINHINRLQIFNSQLKGAGCVARLDSSRPRVNYGAGRNGRLLATAMDEPKANNPPGNNHNWPNTAVNWFSGNTVGDLFLESWQKGNEAAQQLAQLIIATNNRGCTKN